VGDMPKELARGVLPTSTFSKTFFRKKPLLKNPIILKLIF